MAQSHQELFGGAITVKIPSEFADVSNIRQVPDNQEVFLDVNGFSSLTFDLTERVTQFATDKEALEYHFSDILAEGDSKQVWSIHDQVELPKFPSKTPALCLVATTAPPATVSLRPNEPTHTDVQLTLIRLLEQNTDFVVTLNVPCVPSEIADSEGTAESRRQKVVQKMSEICKNILRSLEIKDWSLFGA
ncbi:hypothetical protein P7C71_g908, partial [Lecanoromycetidae sp. Uapishka_2]